MGDILHWTHSATLATVKWLQVVISGHRHATITGDALVMRECRRDELQFCSHASMRRYSWFESKRGSHPLKCRFTYENWLFVERATSRTKTHENAIYLASIRQSTCNGVPFLEISWGSSVNGFHAPG